MPSFRLETFQVVVFDLDDTLISERDYLFAAYRHIARETFGAGSPRATDLAVFLIESFSQSGRIGLFDKAIAEFALPRSHKSNMLEWLRTVQLESPLAIIEPALGSLDRIQGDVAVLTNGNPQQQLNKWGQIAAHQVLKHATVFCAEEYSPKPNPLGLLTICETFNVNPKNVIMVGDSAVDMECALNAGVEFAYVSQLR